MTTTKDKPVGELARTRQTYRPRVDILERENELVVLADMPGAKPDSIDIQFENGTLSIHAKVDCRQPADHGYLLYEYGVGDFQRSFHVSEAVDAEKITAEYVQGVLTLHMPKVEAVKPRRIQVEAR